MSVKKIPLPVAPSGVLRMKQAPPFEKIMVIDGNKVDLVLSRKLIKNARLTRSITLEFKACRVIEQLKKIQKLSDVPELIFLELKLNGFDGFGFLEEFKNLSDFIREKCKIVVISSSEINDDKHKALLYPNVIRFYKKPLNETMLKDLIYS